MRRIIATAITSALAGILVTGALTIDPEPNVPHVVACAPTEDSVMVDCDSGIPLDYQPVNGSRGVWVAR